MSVGDVVEKLVGCFECKQGAVRAVRFNADGNYCMTCGSDKTIKLWNPHKGNIIKVYSGHGYEVLDAQSSCDSSQICSCSLDKTVLLWDVATGKILCKYRGHAGRVNCVRFNEEGSVILSGSLDGTIRAWDCRSRRTEPIQVMDEAKDSVTSLYCTDYEILSGSADCGIRRYDIRNGQLYVDHIDKPVTCVHLTRDGQCILVSYLGNSLYLLDKETGELLNEYRGHVNNDFKLDSVISSNDKQILSGSEDGLVYVWDLVDGKVVSKLTHEAGHVVHSLSYHPTEQCLISACQSKLYVWKTKYGQSVT
jgi:mitogen-activated protein kinase organizer 1